MKKLSAPFIYLAAMFVMGLTANIATTAYVIYRVDVVGMDALQLVLAGTALEASVFLFEVPTGIVADIFSRRLSTIVGIFITGFAILVEGLAPLVWVVLLSQALWGLGWTFVSGAFSAWITDEVGVEKVGDYFLRGRQMSLVGHLVAIPISVLIASHSLALTFIVGGLGRILFGVFLATRMPETGFTPVPKAERQGWHSMASQFHQGLALVRSRRVLMIFSVIALLLGLYSEAWDRLSLAFLLEQFRFPQFGGLQLTDVVWFGILDASILLIGIGASGLAKRRVDTTIADQITRALQAIYIGMVAAILVFVFADSFSWAVTALLIFSALRVVTFPLTDAWLNQHISSKLRATVLSMAGQVDAFGELAAGPVVGSIGRIFSMRAAIVSSALLLSPVVPLFRRIRRTVPED